MQVSVPKQLGLCGSTKSVVSSPHKVACRPRVAVNKSRGLRIRAESGPSEQAMKQTVGGGGYSGTCDIEAVKQVIKDCEGLEGEALEACWADSGCDVNEVTRHYKRLAASRYLSPQPNITNNNTCGTSCITVEDLFASRPAGDSQIFSILEAAFVFPCVLLPN